MEASFDWKEIRNDLRDVSDFFKSIRSVVDIDSQAEISGSSIGDFSVLSLYNEYFLQYMAGLCMFVEAKCAHRDDVIEKLRSILVEDSFVLQRLRVFDPPIRARLDRLLSKREETPRSFHARPESFEFEDAVDSKAQSDLLHEDHYVAPKISSVVIDEDKSSRKALRDKERRAAMANRSQIVQDLREEFGSRPIEKSAFGELGEDIDERKRSGERQKLKRYEESTYKRVMLGRKEKKRLAQHSLLGDTLRNLEHFDDLENVGNPSSDGGANRNKRTHSSSSSDKRHKKGKTSRR